MVGYPWCFPCRGRNCGHTEWCVPPRARKQQRRLVLTGSIAAGELDRDMYAMYQPPTPAGLSDDPERRAYSSVTVLGATTRPRRPRCW